MRLRNPVVAAAMALTAAALSPSAFADMYHGRQAWSLQNDKVAVIVTPGGGHIASMTLRKGRGANVNPLWLPPWRSVEPGGWRAAGGYYGDKPGAQLLCSILGHNICVDFFGAPSAPETKAGIPVHGEAPCVNWTSSSLSSNRVTYFTTLPAAQMKVTRTIRLTPGAASMWISETVENLSALDRPFGWNQHVTLGAPFLQNGASFFDMPSGWGKVFPQEFSKDERYDRGAEFTWPQVPGKGGDTVDAREYPPVKKNSDFIVTLADPKQMKWGWFTAINTKQGVGIGYVWPSKDWPWIANWEENRSRMGNPWKGKGIARGIEFGTSPFPVSKREAVKMGSLHGIPTYRWIDAKGKQTISYGAFMFAIPSGTKGVHDVKVGANGVSIELSGVDRTIRVPLKR
jgi:hypothetical protein